MRSTASISRRPRLGQCSSAPERNVLPHCAERAACEFLNALDAIERELLRPLARALTSMRMVLSLCWPLVSLCTLTIALVFLRLFFWPSVSVGSSVDRQQWHPVCESVTQVTRGMDDEVPVPRRVHEMRRRGMACDGQRCRGENNVNGACQSTQEEGETPQRDQEDEEEDSLVSTSLDTCSGVIRGL